MTCHHCLGQFTARKGGQRFCSAACRNAERAAADRLPPDPDPAPTWEQIGAAIGVSRSRAQQLEASALRKLRAAMGDREAWL